MWVNGIPQLLFGFCLRNITARPVYLSSRGGAGVCTQLTEPTAMRAWRGEAWILRMYIRPFYSILWLRWEIFPISVPYYLCFGSSLRGSAVSCWALRGLSPGSARTRCILQQTTSRASVSPTVTNANQKLEGRKNSVAVAKTFYPPAHLLGGIRRFSSESCWTSETFMQLFPRCLILQLSLIRSWVAWLSPWSARDFTLKCILGGDHCASEGILGLMLPPREQEEEKMVHKISITLKSRNICWRLQVRLENGIYQQRTGI